MNHTERLQTTLKRAEEEAKKTYCNYIGTEHVLLAMLSKENAGVAAAVLGALGVTKERVTGEVHRLLGIKLCRHCGKRE